MTKAWPSLERPLRASRQVLVEGRTAEIFFREWIQESGLTEQMEVRDYTSIQRLTDFLRVFTTLKEFRETVVSIGIVRDAENKPAEAAFDSVCSSLKTAGLTCPDKPKLVKEGSPRTAVFILPDCEQPGILESLCWNMLEEDSQQSGRLQCVNQHMTCLQNASVVIANEAKAKVWTFLAGQGRFDPLVGRAAQAKIWNWNSPVFAPVATFLRAL